MVPLGDTVKLLEISLVIKDLKPVARQAFYEEELPVIENICKEKGLCLFKPGYMVEPAEREIYSNKGTIAKPGSGKRGFTFCYISKDELLAAKAALNEIKQDHRALGELLGYPACCIDFFIANNPKRIGLDNDYELPVLENSVGDTFPFAMNIFQRNEGFCLLSHFPCSLGCSHSHMIARRNFRVLSAEDYQIAQSARLALSGKKMIHGRSLAFV